MELYALDDVAAALDLTRHRFVSEAVGEEVEYRLLAPRLRGAEEPLPLVLHLHGAMSSSASLERAAPLYRALVERGELPRAVVACASTPTSGGFYLDQPGGPRWETLVADELPAQLASELGPFSATALVGASMGGYGALKLAFAAPARYAAVAALSPAVFPGESPSSVPAANVPAVLGELHRAMGAGRDDALAYAEQSVHGRARRNATALRERALPILLDCGAEDEFLLHDGAVHLHELLDELGVAHEFRLVAGAGHTGPQAERRTRDALRFLGAALATA